MRNHGHPPCVMEAVVYENHSQDTRFKELDGVAPTVSRPMEQEATTNPGSRTLM